MLLPQKWKPWKMLVGFLKHKESINKTRTHKSKECIKNALIAMDASVE